jgi:hypothetical protein
VVLKGFKDKYKIGDSDFVHNEPDLEQTMSAFNKNDRLAAEKAGVVLN